MIKSLKKRHIQGTFVLDRGYDNNKIFQYFFENKQHFIIRLTEKRKVFFNEKWQKITDIRQKLKGKIKLDFTFQGKKKTCYISAIHGKISAIDEKIQLIFVYGMNDSPMMLASNIKIENKADVVKIVRRYFSRWRIEEYFKFKKQEYGFENYRVRKLKSMNNLNTMLTYVIGLISILCEEKDVSRLVAEVISESKALKKKVNLWLYQLARGIYNILIFDRTSIREKPKEQKIAGQISLF